MPTDRKIAGLLQEDRLPWRESDFVRDSSQRLRWVLLAPLFYLFDNSVNVRLCPVPCIAFAVSFLACLRRIGNLAALCRL